MTINYRGHRDTLRISGDICESYSSDNAQVDSQSKGVARCHIAFYLPDMKAPIVIRNKEEFVIGRCDVSNRLVPTVDLSRYDARRLGVSRYHVSVIYKDDRFYIKDLNSRNGTWLNYTKLEPQHLAPIQAEDIIQLGYLTLRVG